MSDRDETQFSADRVPPAELAASQRDPESIEPPAPTLLELVSRYGALMAAAERASDEREGALTAQAAALFGEIGRRYRAAQDLTTYTDRATVMETLDGQA